MLHYQRIIRKALMNNKKIQIDYRYGNGALKVNGEEYHVGRISFSEVGGAILSVLKKLYGEYRTIPYSFNSEAYENDRFRAEILALGSMGLLQFRVMRKQ